MRRIILLVALLVAACAAPRDDGSLRVGTYEFFEGGRPMGQVLVSSRDLRLADGTRWRRIGCEGLDARCVAAFAAPGGAVVALASPQPGRHELILPDGEDGLLLLVRSG